MNLAELESGNAANFVAALATIYEHSPWVPERAWSARPFGSVDALHAAMEAAVRNATTGEQLTLICAHPELIGKLAPTEHISEESRSEQASAGLNRSTPEQMDEMRELNRRYRERFGFPFIVAVRGLTRDDIVARLQARTLNERDQEFATALGEIGKIARLRLSQALGA